MKLRIVPSTAATKDLKRLAAQKNAEAYLSVKDTLKAVADAGWADSVSADQIKVIGSGVGEIRDMSAAYRIIFFWHDERKDERVLHLTRVEKKSILKRRRLQKLIKDAEAERRKYLDKLTS